MTVILATPETINEAIQACVRQESSAFAREFLTRDEQQPDSGWRVLANIFNFHFRPGDALSPFGPMMTTPEGRTWIPDDLSTEQLSALNELMRKISSGEFRARVGDVLWLRLRDAGAARLAVEGYLQSARNLEVGADRTFAIARYERAARLARQLGKADPLGKQTLEAIAERLGHYRTAGPRAFPIRRALSLLEELRFGAFRLLRLASPIYSND